MAGKKKQKLRGHEKKVAMSLKFPSKNLIDAIRNCKKKTLDEIKTLLDAAHETEMASLINYITESNPQVNFKDGKNIHHFAESLIPVFAPLFYQNLYSASSCPCLASGAVILHSSVFTFEHCRHDYDSAFSVPLAKPRLQHKHSWVTNSLIVRKGNPSASMCSSWKEMLTPYQYFSLRGYPTIALDDYNEAVNKFDESNARFLVLDCEMVGDSDDNSMLARVSVYEMDTNHVPILASESIELTQPNHKELFDHYCFPDRPVKFWRTTYSGITEKIIEENATMTANQLRLLVKQEVKKYPNTVLVGHAIENDLTILNLKHPLCVDTSILLSSSLAYKNSLKSLAAQYLGRDIQSGDGHDSFEDCFATADLALAIRHSKIMSNLVNVEYLHQLKCFNGLTYFSGSFTSVLDSNHKERDTFDLNELLEFIKNNASSDYKRLIGHDIRRFLAVCEIPNDPEIVKVIYSNLPPGVLLYHIVGIDPKIRNIPKVPGGIAYSFKSKHYSQQSLLSE